jgi:hypothetical protein
MQNPNNFNFTEVEFWILTVQLNWNMVSWLLDMDMMISRIKIFGLLRIVGQQLGESRVM